MRIFTKEHRENLSKARKGFKMTQEQKDKISATLKERRIEPIVKYRGAPWNKGLKNTFVHSIETRRRMGDQRRGSNNYRWISDRSQLAKKQERNDPAYQEWRKSVWLRDNFACKIGNPDCKGRIEAHHILSWGEYPDLRYDLNNGITLCHAHHPRKRAEEKRLQSAFQALVSASIEHHF